METRILILNDNEFNETSLNIVDKLWNVHFKLGPSLFGQKVTIFTNCPLKADEAFDRNKYRELNWVHNQTCSDDSSQYCEIKAWLSGSFNYYFTVDIIDSRKIKGSGYIQVNPSLKVGDNEIVKLDSISCQTVLTKLLGKFSTWKDKLAVTYNSGYNMIHFSPIQVLFECYSVYFKELGGSNSSYSIRNQLKLNQNLTDVTFNDLENFLRQIRHDWKMLSICDVVINHTANDSPWIQDHPECAYNLENSKHLRPAYLLDIALYKFSIEVGKGLWENRGIPTEVTTEDQLQNIMHVLSNEVIPNLRIHEFYQCNVNKLVEEFSKLANTSIANRSQENAKLEICQSADFGRLNCTVDMNLALELYRYKSVNDFERDLIHLNVNKLQEISDHLLAAVNSCIPAIRYSRLQPDGPKTTGISKDNPLVNRYFIEFNSIHDYDNIDINSVEKLIFDDNSAKFFMAHNGWVMNFDPFKNFISSELNVYLRRELISWGDCIKLRYENSPEDCPFLWNLMKEYIEMTARIFDGIRIDNCHSVSVPAAIYFIDCARKINPELYIVAELFTGCDQQDNIFINKLGINSLIREAMSAFDSHELGRLMYRYGGEPVGSFRQEKCREFAQSTVAHAIFYDVTHDNPSFIDKRTVFDTLPSTALIYSSSCAVGSTRGFDELVPHHINVVSEEREYMSWSNDSDNKPGFVNQKNGIIRGKKLICDLHKYLGNNNFSQVFVDQMDPDIVTVTRHNPETHESYIISAFTCFKKMPIENRQVRPINIDGELVEIVLEAEIIETNKEIIFEKDKNWINGLENYSLNVQQHVRLENSKFLEKIQSDAVKNRISLHLKNFKPGSVVVIHVKLDENSRKSIIETQRVLKMFDETRIPDDLNEIFIKEMNFDSLNFALYQCNNEGLDNNRGKGVYDIPNYGPLVYCGLQGIVSLLHVVAQNNDLGHPVCGNLRNGDWLIDYIWKRYSDDTRFKKYLKENLNLIKSLPRYLIPCYFDAMIRKIHKALLQHSYNLMNKFVSLGSSFVKHLAMGSVQFGAFLESAKFSTIDVDNKLTLSAGLPHFTTGYMRNWGRDTFISLRGLFLLTGRYSDARNHILAYASCLRHGLIPNLLDQAENARYNCRDAVWWWLYSIKCYVEEVPNGVAILRDVTSRFYPTDNSGYNSTSQVQPLHDIIQEALLVHFKGLKYRERNAGRQIDSVMTDQGFNVEIGVCTNTGFVFGGNEFNCGTWMDKMGSSTLAGNIGRPATPRDGSAVEIIGLSMAVTKWLSEMHKEGKFPYEYVEKNDCGQVIRWTYSNWSDKILENFEKHFWIGDQEIDPLINRRCIYKDSFNGSQKWADYQLRCNFLISMTVAPELFNPKNAWEALNVIEDTLLGPIGIKTLDPSDWNYRGDYDNSNNSNDYLVAQGFNYHQGPEWVWPVGYYLMARLKFAHFFHQENATIQYVKAILSKHFDYLITSFWRGLPELTNSDGKLCRDSSESQAWSAATILEVLFAIHQMEPQFP